MFALKLINPLLIQLTRLSVLHSRSRHAPTSPAEMDGPAPSVDESDEQAFISAIAHLPAAERQRRIERRNAYRQMVERQRIIEAEHESANAPWLWEWLGMDPPQQ